MHTQSTRSSVLTYHTTRTTLSHAHNMVITCTAHDNRMHSTWQLHDLLLIILSVSQSNTKHLFTCMTYHTTRNTVASLSILSSDIKQKTLFGFGHFGIKTRLEWQSSTVNSLTCFCKI